MHLRTAIILAVLMTTISGCGDEETPVRPGYVIAEDTFVRVLADHALAESAMALNIRGVRSDRIDSVYAFDPLAENGVSRAAYDSTIAWYARHPELYKQVYRRVLDSLSAFEARRKATKTDTVKPPSRIQGNPMLDRFLRK